MASVVVSVSHDVMPDDCKRSRPWEVDYGGWYLTLLRALSQKYLVVAVHPTFCDNIIIFKDNFIMLKLPVKFKKYLKKLNLVFKNLSLDLHIDTFEPDLYHIAKRFAETTDGITYMHEFRRRLGAYYALRRYHNLPIILQRHAALPPRNLHKSSILRRSYWYAMEGILRKLKRRIYFHTCPGGGGISKESRG